MFDKLRAEGFDERQAMEVLKVWIFAGFSKPPTITGT